MESQPGKSLGADSSSLRSRIPNHEVSPNTSKKRDNWNMKRTFLHLLIAGLTLFVMLGCGFLYSAALSSGDRK
jgi:hypothetical protein